MLPIFNLTGPFDKTCDLSDTYYTNTKRLDLLVFEYVFIELIHSFE